MALSAASVARRAVRHVGALIFVALIAMVGVLASGTTVSAHTDFAGSTPSADDVVDEPVEVVSLTFTGEAEEAGDGFVVLDATGQIREPNSVSTPDNKVFNLTFDPPLAGGEIGVRWSVRAPDTHPISGSFSFTVKAPLPTTTAAPTTAASQNAATTSSSTTSETTTTAIAVSSDDAPDRASNDGATALDDFLAVDSGPPGESLATAGRLLSLLGVALSIGGIAFLWTTLRGDRSEIGTLVNGIRIVGLVIVVGAAMEYTGVARIAGDSLAGTWSSSAGFAATLRIIAGIAVAVGLASTTAAFHTARSPRSVSAAATAVDVHRHDSVAGAPSDLQQWIPSRSSALAFVGCGLMVVSFWFDGHTVSEGWRPLHAVTNSVHVVAGSIWTGGVVALAATMWVRHRRGVPTRALDLVVRFSSVAAMALAAVVVAGLIMAVSILDSFGELTGTEWGRLFLLKSAAAGLAALGGAYNHFRLLPALNADPGDPALRERVRAVVTAEAIMLGFVVVVTAWLVSAAT